MGHRDVKPLVQALSEGVKGIGGEALQALTSALRKKQDNLGEFEARAI